ncbi:hypothetical protein NL676_024866 [Syzygium grande]|nr:hypothetical protein NL676_024866 [Syzygium grande]
MMMPELEMFSPAAAMAVRAAFGNHNPNKSFEGARGGGDGVVMAQLRRWKDSAFFRKAFDVEAMHMEEPHELKHNPRRNIIGLRFSCHVLPINIHHRSLSSISKLARNTKSCFAVTAYIFLLLVLFMSSSFLVSEARPLSNVAADSVSGDTMKKGIEVLIKGLYVEAIKANGGQALAGRATVNPASPSRTLVQPPAGATDATRS